MIVNRARRKLRDMREAATDFISGWATTLHIMIFERETYRALRDYSEFNEDDFVEVGRPDLSDWDSPEDSLYDE